MSVVSRIRPSGSEDAGPLICVIVRIFFRADLNAQQPFSLKILELHRLVGDALESLLRLVGIDADDEIVVFAQTQFP